MKQLLNLKFLLILFICVIPVLCNAGEGTVSEPAAVKALMLRQGFTEEIAQQMADLAAKRKEAMKPGMCGELIFKVEPLEKPKTDQAALRIIASRPELLPRRTFEELTGVKQVTRENLPKVLDALLDPSDLPQWLRGPNGEELKAEAMRKEAEKVISLRKTLPETLERMKKLQGEESLNNLLEIFNSSKDRAIYPNRVVYQHIFIRSLWLTRKADERLLLSLTKLAKDFLILTGRPDLSAVGAQVSLGSYCDDVKKQPILSSVIFLNDRALALIPPCTVKEQLIASLVVKELNSYSYSEVKGWLADDYIKKAKKTIEEDKKTIEESKKNIEESKKNIEEDRKLIKFYESYNVLIHRLDKNIKAYLSKPNEVLRKHIGFDIAELKNKVAEFERIMLIGKEKISKKDFEIIQEHYEAIMLWYNAYLKSSK